MGKKPSTRARDNSRKPGSGIADALFTNTQQRLLALLFGQPERSFYASELIALAKCGSGTVQRELARLAASGLVTLQKIGNQRHYQANPQSPVFAELCSIALKTVALAEPLRAVLAPLAGEISAAFVYGSIAKGTDTATSDIDLMIVSDSLTYGDVFSALDEVSHKLGRPVNPTVVSQTDWRKRIDLGEAFLTRVLGQPKIWIVGSEHEFAA